MELGQIMSNDVLETSRRYTRTEILFYLYKRPARCTDNIYCQQMNELFFWTNAIHSTEMGLKDHSSHILPFLTFLKCYFYLRWDFNRNKTFQNIKVIIRIFSFVNWCWKTKLSENILFFFNCYQCGHINRTAVNYSWKLGL